ncbi:putative uncharacterized protein DDB_G0283051 isoform X2 [Orbicella faveolata]|uniref:putative uncharacterized protein DDB_G0283051 isoform X2 n=1 Tax=Orbicella faveolata TaxID=48498 RepID=UPI0009E5D645|nr:putative uncharacterized protein DDB_G0283051 isoform X2 [Orbicella faveolata]
MEAQPVQSLTRDIVILFRFDMLVYDSQGLLSLVHCSMTFSIFIQRNGLHFQGWAGAYLLERRPLLIMRVIHVRCLAGFVFFAYSRDSQSQENHRQDNHDQNNRGQDNHGQNNQGRDNHDQNNRGQDNYGQNNQGQDNNDQNSHDQNDNNDQNNQGQDNHDQNNRGQDNHGQNNQGQDNNDQEDQDQEWLGMSWISDEL